MPWSESPSYVLRRWTVLWALHDVPAGRLLEIGCGAGDLLAKLMERGHEGFCVEISPTARDEATRLFASLGRKVTLASDLAQITGSFDLLVACEVLEHIEEDESALKTWAARLVPGGWMLITVPAHPGRFGASDQWAGHYRRYTREELEEKAQRAGLKIERLVCFGFPLGNLIEPVRNWVNRARLAKEGNESRLARTWRSGVDRSVEARFRFLARPWLILPFCWIQFPFFGTELGTGYLLLARRPR